MTSVCEQRVDNRLESIVGLIACAHDWPPTGDLGIFRYSPQSFSMLASVLGEVCKIIKDESGKPVSPQFKDELADRITSRALDGETDPRRLRAFALGRPMPGEEN